VASNGKCDAALCQTPASVHKVRTRRKLDNLSLGVTALDVNITAVATMLNLTDVSRRLS
jgi:hypothetical protein